MVGCETYAEYIARITRPVSTWDTSWKDVPSLHKAYAENDLDGRA